MSAYKEDYDALISTVKSFDGMVDDATAHEVVYWYLTRFHMGQSCDLYALRRYSAFKPGPFTKEPHPDTYENTLICALASHEGHTISSIPTGDW